MQRLRDYLNRDRSTDELLVIFWFSFLGSCAFSLLALARLLGWW